MQENKNHRKNRYFLFNHMIYIGIINYLTYIFYVYYCFFKVEKIYLMG
ncbi:hypothetical protein CKO_00425 [Citrobacter koseri ATCC BAA-895]|uniref:Uncharacterized protein n=1 Tax=Citrobacter koseri (strain ATCC BAA-895 / CDC 4225-83 / SGSC4696) TaxID=290338 RepID=A8ADL9_CITK8|nr:hypothetical protein CKO_00425 [Citrobacter koseri ATCC BAA-895]